MLPAFRRAIVSTSWRQRVAALATQRAQRPALLASLCRELPRTDGAERLELTGVIVGLELSLGHWEIALRRAGELAALASTLNRADQEAVARLQAARALEAQGRLRTAARVLEQVRRLTDLPELQETGQPVRLKAAAIAARIAARRGQARRARSLAHGLAQQDLPDDPELHAARIYDDLDPATLVDVLVRTEEPLLAPALAEVAGMVPASFEAAAERLRTLGRADLADTFLSHRFRKQLESGQALNVLETIDARAGELPAWLRATLAVEEIRAALQLGDIARAASATEHLAVLDELGFEAHAALVRLEAARANGHRGRLAEARDLLLAGRDQAVSLGQEVLAATLTLELASVHRALREPQQAAALLDGLELPVPAIQARRSLLLAHLALDVGTPDAAQKESLRHLAEQARQLGLRLHADALEKRLAL